MTSYLATKENYSLTPSKALGATAAHDAILGSVDHSSRVGGYRLMRFRHKEGRPLTPYTCLAPALAANMDRMPVPLPTSSTILSLKMCLLWYMEFLYVNVLTSSFSISCKSMNTQKPFTVL